jgi:hypothetical protein
LCDKEIKKPKFFFVEEKGENSFITYRLYANVCTAVLISRGDLQKIFSNPKDMGFGTQMLEYIENFGLENGFTKIFGFSDCR